MKSKMIYCPKCRRKVATYDGRATINKIAKCKKCDLQVIYDVARDETTVKPLPKRETSSGVVLY